MCLFPLIIQVKATQGGGREYGKVVDRNNNGLIEAICSHPRLLLPYLNEQEREKLRKFYFTKT